MVGIVISSIVEYRRLLTLSLLANLTGIAEVGYGHTLAKISGGGVLIGSTVRVP